MKQQVSISVLMTAYNAASYIEASIQSILDQTYADFEFVILDDGSTDQTLDKIKAINDPRIKCHQNDGNKGLTYSRNKCLELARGKYVAWLDADDLSTHDRLAKQFAFMEANPDFAMVGGWVQPIDRHGKESGQVWKYFAKPEEIPSLLFFGNYFAQSAVMIRKSMLPETWYDEAFPPVEDYELWIRLIQKGKCWNMPVLFLYYRVYEESITFRASEKHQKGMQQISKNQLINLGTPETDLKPYLDLLQGKIKNFMQAFHLYKALGHQNKSKKSYPDKIFTTILLHKLLLRAKSNPLNLLKILSSEFVGYLPYW
ncbi:MAG: glycosyltransferase, partial [Cyclobacteriaceae bacterium]